MTVRLCYSLDAVDRPAGLSHLKITAKRRVRILSLACHNLRVIAVDLVSAILVKLKICVGFLYILPGLAVVDLGLDSLDLRRILNSLLLIGRELRPGSVSLDLVERHRAVVDTVDIASVSSRDLLSLKLRISELLFGNSRHSVVIMHLGRGITLRLVKIRRELALVSRIIRLSERTVVLGIAHLPVLAVLLIGLRPAVLVHTRARESRGGERLLLRAVLHLLPLIRRIRVYKITLFSNTGSGRCLVVLTVERRIGAVIHLLCRVLLYLQIFVCVLLCRRDKLIRRQKLLFVLILDLTHQALPPLFVCVAGLAACASLYIFTYSS